MFRNSKIIGIVLLAVSIYTLQSCEDSVTTTKVITEDVLFVSADKATLSGRIYELSGNADDHGFQIDVSVEFNTPIEISLGPQSKLGKFIGEAIALTPHTAYFYRAYIQEGGKNYFGDAKPVETGSPSFKTMNPVIGYPRDIITVTGSNIPEGVRVLIGNTEAEIYDLSLESTLKFKVPFPGEDDTFLSEVKFVMGSDTVIYSQPFEYITGTWQKLDDFIEPISIYNGISFKQDNQYYFGLGIKKGQTALNNRIWKLDLGTWNWTEVAFGSPGFHSGFSSDLGYFGTGVFNWEVEIMNQKLWQQVGGSFVEINPTPFKLYTPVSATVNETLYVGGGQVGHNTDNYNLYKYNSSLDTWEVDTTIPFLTNSGYGVFSYQDNIYFIIKDGSLWKYDTINKVWTKISKTPFTVRTGSICTVIGSKAYFGVGSDNVSLLEYDILSNTWKEKTKFPGDKALINAGFFSYNDKIYTLRTNLTGAGSLIEIWEFDPQAF